jgi:hypothetical protein
LTEIAERTREYVHVAKYVARKPSEARWLPRWFKERSASPMTLRMPWWPFPVPEFVRDVLPEAPRVFEFGAGGSTLWLEDLGADVTAVEHDREWYELLSREVRSPTKLVLREPSDVGEFSSEIAPGYFDAYLSAIDAIPCGSLDLVTIDGRCRVEAGLRSIDRLRPGGWLLLDDSWRPKYERLGVALEGYERHDFEGLRPAGGTPSTTSCWKIHRPPAP